MSISQRSPLLLLLVMASAGFILHPSRKKVRTGKQILQSDNNLSFNNSEAETRIEITDFVANVMISILLTVKALNYLISSYKKAEKKSLFYTLLP